MKRRIEFLAYPDVQILDVTGPLQVFASANEYAAQNGKPKPYELATVAWTTPVLTSSALPIIAEDLPNPEAPLDTLVIPGGYGINAVCDDPAQRAWFTTRSKNARRTASVCSGAFLLATIGLLDGKRATTHWQRCAELKKRFPNVRLESDPIFIRDGNIWTSAGITAGIDLALALVQDDLGRETALAVARQLVVFLKRPGGQSQYSAALQLQNDSGRFDQLHGWMLQNINRAISLADMAEQAGMSPRTLSRRYKQETGRTPMRALEDLRLEQARQLLERGAHIGRAAAQSGFATEETMRLAFHRRIGISPQTYKDRFSI